MRGKLGLLGLAATLAVGNMAAGTAAPTLSRAPGNSPVFTVWNEGPDEAEVQIRARGTLIFGPQKLNANDGTSEPIRLVGAACTQTLGVRVSGRVYQVAANLCPESYPEEVKALWVFGTSHKQPAIIGEDVE